MPKIDDPTPDWKQNLCFDGWTTFAAVKSHIFDLDLSWYCSQVRPAAEVFFFSKRTQTGRLCSSQLCEAALCARGTSFINDQRDFNVAAVFFIFSVWSLKVAAAQCRISAAAQQIEALWVTTAGLDRWFPHRGLFVTSQLNVSDSAAQGATLTMWDRQVFDTEITLRAYQIRRLTRGLSDIRTLNSDWRWSSCWQKLNTLKL